MLHFSKYLITCSNIVFISMQPATYTHYSLRSVCCSLSLKYMEQNFWVLRDMSFEKDWTLWLVRVKGMLEDSDSIDHIRLELARNGGSWGNHCWKEIKSFGFQKTPYISLSSKLVLAEYWKYKINMAYCSQHLPLVIEKSCDVEFTAWIKRPCHGR